ncbi:CapA family protein [Mesorhizobium sp.]|uniref:CapA family protein n=1 Tax=Mesorhizobium sp. TaxID=1871066 RepID=UPI00257A45BD|nr:CapA family protein [Mesorhizobium sp.]
MNQEPPDYDQSFARKLIDAGPDAYVGHGPHLLQGIEITAYGEDPRRDTDAKFTVDEEAKGYPTQTALWVRSGYPFLREDYSGKPICPKPACRTATPEAWIQLRKALQRSTVPIFYLQASIDTPCMPSISTRWGDPLEACHVLDLSGL